MLIALGSNLTSTAGSPENTLREAVVLLENAGGVIRKLSHFYQTSAFPAGAGPDFVNAAAEIDAPWPIAEAMIHLHAVEQELGRVRQHRWGQRTLDLDLLGAGDQVLPDRDVFQRWHDLPLAEQLLQTPDQLVLPHPRLHERSFVLVPLRDVAPDWCHPIFGQTVTQMCAALSEEDKANVRRLA